MSCQPTVLEAWREIGGALSSYTAEQQKTHRLALRVRSAGDAWQLAQARYGSGTAGLAAVLGSQRSHLQARRDLQSSRRRLNTRYAAIQKAVGKVPGTQERSTASSGQE